jgi:hypothetical protein
MWRDDLATIDGVIMVVTDQDASIGRIVSRIGRVDEPAKDLSCLTATRFAVRDWAERTLHVTTHGLGDPNQVSMNISDNGLHVDDVGLPDVELPDVQLLGIGD